MRAAVMYDRGDIRLENVDRPVTGVGEVLVAVATVGVCGTDATEYAHGPRMFPIHQPHPVTGHLGPMVPGHEFSGRVVEVGPGVVGFGEGDLVVSGAGISCGSCSRCRAGRTNLCERYSTVGLSRNGALAEFVAVPADSCLNLAGRPISPDVAALGQPMAIAVHAMRRGDLAATDRAAIIGGGGIGAFLAHAAAATGADLTVADLRSDRLEVSAMLGAGTTVAVERETPLVDQLGGPASFDVVYECTAVPAALQSALALVRPGGRVVAVGIPKEEIALDINGLVLQEKDIVGTLAHVFGSDLPEAIDLLQASPHLWPAVAPDVLPLEDLIDEGLQPMLDGSQVRIKALLSPGVDRARPLVTEEVA